MDATAMSQQGQETAPADVCEALSAHADDRVAFLESEPDRALIAADCSVTELKGMFGRPVRTVSVDEMNRAIAAKGASAG